MSIHPSNQWKMCSILRKGKYATLCPDAIGVHWRSLPGMLAAWLGQVARAQLSQFSSTRPHQRENPQLDKSDGITEFYSGLWPQLLRAGVNCFELTELEDDRAGRGSVGDEPRGLDLPAGPAQHLLLLLLLLRPPPPQQQLTFAVRLTSTSLLSSPPWNWDFYTGWLRHPCLWGAPGKPVKSIHVYWTSGILHFVQCTRLYKTEEDADPIQAQFCSIMKLFRTFSRHSPPCRHGRHPLQTQGHLLPSSK